MLKTMEQWKFTIVVIVVIVTPEILRCLRACCRPVPGPAGPDQHCHVTHASCGARVAPVGPAATPPATWRSPWQPGRRGEGRDLRSPPASTRLGPEYARDWGGTWCIAPMLAMQSVRPNTNWHFVIGLGPSRCLRMNIPCRVYRVTS
jgi:hypothetical protein